MKPADALKIIQERAQDAAHIFVLRHEGVVNGDRLHVVVELPKEPPDL